MKIESLKDLKALIKLCRQLGVDSIEADGVKLNLGATPVSIKTKKQAKSISYTSDGTLDIPDNIDMPDELTPEQMLFYSAVPHEQGEQ